MADQDNDSRDDDNKPSRPTLSRPERKDDSWDTGTRTGPRARKALERAREASPARPARDERPARDDSAPRDRADGGQRNRDEGGYRNRDAGGFRGREGGGFGERREGGFRERGERDSGDRKPYGERREGGFAPRGDRPRFNREGGDRPPFNREGGERPSFNREGGDRPPFRGREEGGFRERREGGGFGERREGGTREDRPFRERGERDFGDRKPFGERREGGFHERGDRPRFDREGGDRPRFERDGGDRPRFNREGGDRPPFRGREEGGFRERREGGGFGERREGGFRDGGNREDRPFRERGERDFGDRKPFAERREGGFRERGDRPFQDRGDRPRFDREGGDRPRFDRDGERPRFNREGGDRPPFNREGGDRPPFRGRDEGGFRGREGGGFGERREGGFRERDGGDRKPFHERGDRPFQDRGDRPRFDREGGDRPRFNREGGDRPPFNREGGDRPPFRGRDEGSFRGREGGGFGERREGGFRERGERDSGDRKPFHERGDRPFQDRGDRPRFERDDRPRFDRDGDRPRYNREGGDRPRFDRGDRPRFERNERPAGARPAPAPKPAPAGLAEGIARWFSPCPRGLEPVLRDELVAIGAGDVAIVPGGVKFTGDHRLGMRVNLESRIASRVLRAIHDAPYRDEHDLNAIAAGIDWAAWFSPECTIKVELVAQRSPLRSLEFTTLRIKDAICDRFRDETGERPSIDTSTPDVRINVFCDERDATFYLDTSGEALFKRGWRLDKVAAPLRENLAAGLIALSGWTADKPLLDPFCGSGTIPVEAAHIAFGRAPGLEREFAFRHLAGFDGKVWDALLADARARINDEADARIFGGDISIAALPAAKANAERAGVEIEWRQIDARQAEPPTTDPGVILCNPPYGERIHVRGRPVEQEDEDDREFFEEFGRALKERFTGWRVALLSSDPNIVGKLRLKPSRSIALFNGALACKLHIFEIHANSGADFDAEEAKALGSRLVEDDADVENATAEDSLIAEDNAAVATDAAAEPPATEPADQPTDLPADPEVPQSPADVDADAGTPPAGADADAESDPTPAGPEAHDQR